LDVTDGRQIHEAAVIVKNPDILINNSGTDLHDNLNDRAGGSYPQIGGFYGEWI
jgi:hypothetical protein